RGGPPADQGLRIAFACLKNWVAAARGLALPYSTPSAAWVNRVRIWLCPAGGGAGGRPNRAAYSVSNATVCCIGAVSSGAIWLRTLRLGARPRSAPRMRAASGSLTRKSIRSATSLGCLVWLKAAQYIEARNHCPDRLPG